MVGGRLASLGLTLTLNEGKRGISFQSSLGQLGGIHKPFQGWYRHSIRPRRHYVPVEVTEGHLSLSMVVVMGWMISLRSHRVIANFVVRDFGPS